jgi:hypothetical protein
LANSYFYHRVVKKRAYLEDGVGGLDNGKPFAGHDLGGGAEARGAVILI